MYQEVYDHREPTKEEMAAFEAAQKKYRDYGEYVFCLLFAFFALWYRPLGTWYNCIVEFISCVIFSYFVLFICKDMVPALFEKVDEKTKNWKLPGLTLFCVLLFVVVGWFSCTKSMEWYAAKESMYAYVTRTGECYHTEDCPALDGAGICFKVEKETAEDYGYTACTKCNP